MKKYILSGGIGAIIILLLLVTVPINQPIEQVELIQIESTAITQPVETELDFSINVKGGMHDKSYLTISGTIPKGDKHLTGIIYTGENEFSKVVYVFQLQSLENIYETKVGINDDYLWEEDTTYIISINHNGILKEKTFYRGTLENNFEDSIL